jgi:hypothetical protein
MFDSLNDPCCHGRSTPNEHRIARFSVLLPRRHLRRKTKDEDGGTESSNNAQLPVARKMVGHPVTPMSLAQ